MKILLLGCTGKIGTLTFEVINELNSYKDINFEITGLAAGENIEMLEKQINFIQKKTIKFIYIKNKKYADMLSKKYKEIFFLSGENGLGTLCEYCEYDIMVNALSGITGLLPSCKAASKGKRIAIANKESIISGGNILLEISKKNNSLIIPVDSEHSAIFQLLQNKNKKDIKNIILTATGGPFKNFSYKKLKNVMFNDSIKHPVWDMGKKISIDSATMINKAFEIIEAYYLFGIDIDKINAIIHPQGIVHSMVEFIDNTIISQMSYPSMKFPIQFALTYPYKKLNQNNSINFEKSCKLTFEKLSKRSLSIINFFKESIKLGSMATTALCSSDEEAINAFMYGKIKFTDIEKVIRLTFEKIKFKNINSIEEIIETDFETRKICKEIIKLL